MRFFFFVGGGLGACETVQSSRCQSSLMQLTNWLNTADTDKVLEIGSQYVDPLAWDPDL
jgi:hypothetical protein